MSPLAEALPLSLPETTLLDLAEIAVAAHQNEIATEIRQTDAALARGALTIAVLGQFKRGKSTLLNALAGREVFPTGLLPLTAVATHLVRGPPGARITEPDGTVRPVDVSEIADYVSERRNPGNRHGIGRVEISMPLPEWTEGVTFVDSPGIGSPHDANTSAARALLPQADAALFVLSPDPSITSEEIAFLSEASSYAARFFFVLNKSDLVQPAELTDLEEYLQGILRDRCGFGLVRLYPLSARNALEGLARGDPSAGKRSGVGELWEELHRFIGPDRVASVREVVRVRIRQFSGRIRALIELSLKASQLSLAEYDRRLALLEKGIADVRVEHRATQAMLREEVAALSQRIAPLPRHEVELHLPELTERLDRFLSTPKGGTAGAVVRGFEEEFQREVGPVVREIRSQLANGISGDLARIAREFETRLERWFGHLASVVAHEFGVQLPGLSVEGSLAAPGRYTDRVEKLYEGTMAGQTALLLPATLLRRRIRSRLPRLVTEELDAQAGRISSDLLDRIDRSWDVLRAHVTDQLERNIRLLEESVNEGRRRQATTDGETAAWKAKMESLRARVDEAESRSGPTSIRPN